MTILVGFWFAWPVLVVVVAVVGEGMEVVEGMEMVNWHSVRLEVVYERKVGIVSTHFLYD